MKRWFFPLIVFFTLIQSVSLAQPSLILPLKWDQIYRITIGYNGVPAQPYEYDPYHVGNDQFAIDFGHPIDNPNPEIIAVADGDVIRSREDTGGYGSHIIIKHQNIYTTTYGHLSRRDVFEGEHVIQGQVIGLMGKTGGYDGEHLHFVLKQNGSSIRPEPISGFTDLHPNMYFYPVGMFPDGWHNDISPIFRDFFIDPNNGGIDSFGKATSQVHLWGDLWVQDFWKGDIWCQFVLNPINNHVYAVFNKILRYWHDNWGYRDYGAPMTNEFLSTYIGGLYGIVGDQIVVQKFVKQNELVRRTIIYNTRTGQTGHYPTGVFSVESSKIKTGWWCYEYFSSTNKVRLPVVDAKNGKYEWLCDEGQHNFCFCRDIDMLCRYPLAHYVVEGNDQVWSPDIPGDDEPPLEENPLLWIYGTGFDFDTNYNDADLRIRNDGTGTLSWSVSFDKNWLTFSQASGDLSAGQEITTKMYLDRSKIVSGNNYGTLIVSSNGGDKQLSVRAVGEGSQPPPSEQPILNLFSANTDFDVNYTELNFWVKNAGEGILTWSASFNKDWGSLSLTSGSLSANREIEVILSLKLDKLAYGDNTGKVTVTSNGGNQELSFRAVGVIKPPPPEQHAYLSVNSDPSGATITLDETTLWPNWPIGHTITPSSVNQIEAGRDHSIRLNLTGYQSQTKTFTPVLGDTIVLEFKLVKEPDNPPPPTENYAYLSVVSDPTGASIFLDGDFPWPNWPVGHTITPSGVNQIEAGREHSIQLTLDGYEPHSQTFTPVLDDTLVLTIKLQKILPNLPPVEPKDLAGQLIVDDGKIDLTGNIFGPGQYCRLILAGGDNIIIRWDILSSGKTFEIPIGYTDANVSFSDNDSHWYYEDRGNCRISSNVKYHDGWFHLDEFIVIDTTAVPTTKVSQMEFIFSQNYPNPFNATTKLEFFLPKTTRIEIKIFDALGHTILTEESTRQTGWHSFLWNGKNSVGESVPSGTYLFFISSPIFTDSRRFVVVK